jgi:hypothetical protein
MENELNVRNCACEEKEELLNERSKTIIEAWKNYTGEYQWNRLLDAYIEAVENNNNKVIGQYWGETRTLLPTDRNAMEAEFFSYIDGMISYDDDHAGFFSSTGIDEKILSVQLLVLRGEKDIKNEILKQKRNQLELQLVTNMHKILNEK